ncbi:hypothetical protein V5799_019108 [Amblyomma americanum]|uniref:Uncharacterized protein n=1 Tax=Amblyomma americanum TaxID=6943 RepID=A0AAQ4EXU4_AMBAM
MFLKTGIFATRSTSTGGVRICQSFILPHAIDDDGNHDDGNGLVTPTAVFSSFHSRFVRAKPQNKHISAPGGHLLQASASESAL